MEKADVSLFCSLRNGLVSINRFLNTTCVVSLRTVFCFVLLLGLMGPVRAQTPDRAVVLGRVVDAAGAGIPFVNVYLEGTTEGAATDRSGAFQFATRRGGRQRVRATMIGYEPAVHAVELTPGDTVVVRLVLKETLLRLEEADVTAHAYTTGEAETVTLSPLEVVTTPGAAADIFRAIQTFPGVAIVDEGAGLFVRGGDVTETVTLLDQATVVHPYKYESPTGGVFGTIPPFLVSGTYFSSGGFSARYGNALSAVLAMESQNLPPQTSYTANLGLAAASLGANVPVVPGKFGLRFSGNRSFTGLLFRVNGQREEFTKVPQGLDGNLSLVYQYSPTGRLKLFNFVSDDHLGVHVTEPSFDGVYRGKTTNSLHNLQWTEIFGDWLIQTSLSINRYEARQQLGSLDLRPGDRTIKLRSDVEHGLGTRARLALGGEVERIANTFRGTIPLQDDVLDPQAAVYVLDEQYAATRTGAYAEFEWQPARRIVTKAGVRTDYHAPARQAVVDPRLSFQFAWSKNTRAWLAWGRYHQFPTPYQYNPESGNPALRAQQAQHYVAGLHHERELLTLRAEVYHKPYRRLALRVAEDNLDNTGHGRARGVDLFAKYGAFLRTRFNGWIAYSFLQSRRLQVRHRGEKIVHEQGPSPFDITHNLSVIGKMRVVGFLSTGLGLRYATGRPVTPIVDAVAVEGEGYYLPVEGPVGSERLPTFVKLEAQASYLLPFRDGSSAIFYLALSNVLNRANVIDYEYSTDYAERTARTTNFRRSVYFGVTVTLNP